MEGGSVRILDGSQIRDALPSISSRARQRFSELDTSHAGFVGAEQVRAAAEAEAAALLLGAELSSQILNRAFLDLSSPLPSSLQQMDEAAFEQNLRDYLKAVSDALQEEPIVVSVLDGSAIRTLLEDEDEFAMLAENLFIELDEDDSGKLSRHELKAALLSLGVDVGVPPSGKPQADELISNLLKKFGCEGSEELGQAQFAELLQKVLKDLADSLSSRPIVVVHNLKVLNGSFLRKVLADDKTLSEISETIFQGLDNNHDGKLSKGEIRPIFESKGVQWGLPPLETNVSSEQIYDQVFEAVDADGSGELDKQEFNVLVKALFESFATQLQLNPIFLDAEIAYQ